MQITQKQILDNMYISDITLTKYGIDKNYNSSVIDFMMDCKDHKKFVIDVIFTCNLIPEEYAKKFSKWCIENVIHLTNNQKLLDYFHNIDNLPDVEEELTEIILSTHNKNKSHICYLIKSYITNKFHNIAYSTSFIFNNYPFGFNYLLPHNLWFTEDEALNAQYDKIMKIFHSIESSTDVDFEVIDYVSNNFENLDLNFNNGDSLFLSSRVSDCNFYGDINIRKKIVDYNITAVEWASNCDSFFADVFAVVKGNKQNIIDKVVDSYKGKDYVKQFLTKGDVIFCTHDLKKAISLINKHKEL